MSYGEICILFTEYATWCGFVTPSFHEEGVGESSVTDSDSMEDDFILPAQVDEMVWLYFWRDCMQLVFHLGIPMLLPLRFDKRSYFRDQVCIRDFKNGLNLVSAIFSQLVSSVIALDANMTRDPAETKCDPFQQHVLNHVSDCRHQWVF